eukprot:1276180-Rhodomonas_salina.5
MPPASATYQTNIQQWGHSAAQSGIRRDLLWLSAHSSPSLHQNPRLSSHHHCPALPSTLVNRQTGIENAETMPDTGGSAWSTNFSTQGRYRNVVLCFFVVGFLRGIDLDLLDPGSTFVVCRALRSAFGIGHASMCWARWEPRRGGGEVVERKELLSITFWKRPLYFKKLKPNETFHIDG